MDKRKKIKLYSIIHFPSFFALPGPDDKISPGGRITGGACIIFAEIAHCKKKYAAVWNQKLYLGEYSGISSLKLKNSGI
jgi:hypothetical protein